MGRVLGLDSREWVYYWEGLILTPCCFYGFNPRFCFFFFFFLLFLLFVIITHDGLPQRTLSPWSDP